MATLYHGVPEKIVGGELMPLIDVAQYDQELKKQYEQKYQGREAKIDEFVQLLDCSWSEVVNLLPVHPQKLFELQKDLGLIKETPRYTYFMIDAQKLDPAKTVVFFKSKPGYENAQFKWLSEVNLDELDVIPEATRRYYENMMSSDQPVFNYQFVPHVLYKGHIDLDGVELLDLRA